MANDSPIAVVAGIIGQLITFVANQLGEPVADVRKRVLAQIAADAADPTDETDAAAAEIDAALPESSER